MEEIKGQKLEAFTFLDRINKEKWTASHDGGWRCGILTTNMSECINGVLKGARRLPVTAIVEITLQRTAHYFREGVEECCDVEQRAIMDGFCKKEVYRLGRKNLLLIQSRNTITCNPPRSLQNANKDLDSTPMLSNLLTGNVHAANGINLVSLALTLKNLKNIGMFRILSWYTTLLFVPLHVLVEAKHHVFRTRWIGDKREQDNKPNEEENLQDNQM
ncbi:UNVERIFIED_CONTAM: hypothetical protein Sradi_5382000 [Sesamum radiatum]|uniref:Uncharacterized protein n=1 Tax=Sesamum radiatum TaxID=300843 RepID=A0AAW2LS55_SESRA